MSTSSLVFKGKKLTSKNNYLEQLPEAKLFLEVNEFMPFIDNSIKAPNKSLYYITTVRFTGHVGRKASEGLRKAR